jgi:hypothetical protein
VASSRIANDLRLGTESLAVENPGAKFTRVSPKARARDASSLIAELGLMLYCNVGVRVYLSPEKGVKLFGIVLIRAKHRAFLQTVF